MYVSVYIGTYLYIESSVPRRPGDRAVLQSATFPAAVSYTCLTFYYHMLGSGIGSLVVYTQTVQGGNNMVLWTLSGDQGNHWLQANVPISTSTPYQVGIYVVMTITDCRPMSPSPHPPHIK
jgi:hypothetical protein